MTEAVVAIAGVLLGFFLSPFSDLPAFLLRRVIGPAASLSRNQCHPVFVTDTANRPGFFARVRVSNDHFRTLYECRGYLIKIEKWTGNGYYPTPYDDCIQLIWSYDPTTDSVIIPKEVSRYLDVFSVDGSTLSPQFRSDSYQLLMPTEYKELFEEHGQFRYTILVTAREARPERIDLEFKFNGDGKPDLIGAWKRNASAP